MSDNNAIELIKRSDQRFAARSALDSFRQELALMFSPVDASWTGDLNLGDDFASHLVDGTPILMARDYVNMIGSMLRPDGKQWFWRRTSDEEINEDPEVRDYLDRRSRLMRRIIYSRNTGAQRALKHCDRFYGLYGDAVLSVDTCKHQETLRIGSYHTNDCVWAEGDDNKVCVITRRMKVPLRAVAAKFGEQKLHEKSKERLRKNPDELMEIRHDVLPIDEYEVFRNKDPWGRDQGKYASVWTDVDNKVVLRQVKTPTFRYVVPRAITMPHTQYGMSTASWIALPDARLIQQQALAIIDAAERQVDPPLVAQDGDTIRGAPDLTRGSINWVDRSYDDKQGPPLMPLEIAKNFSLGLDALMRTEAQITRAFNLDTLRMPDTRNSRSVEEVQFKIDEYVRSALPLFAPMQEEYNQQLLYEVDAACEAMGMFSDEHMPIPEALRDLHPDDVEYAWDNPLTEMMERQKAQTAGEISQLAQALVALEQSAQQAPAIKRLDVGKMFVDAAVGIGGAKYLLSEDDAEEAQQQIAEQQQIEQAVAAAPNVARIIDSGVNAAQAASEIPVDNGALDLPLLTGDI